MEAEEATTEELHSMLEALAEAEEANAIAVSAIREKLLYREQGNLFQGYWTEWGWTDS